MNPKYYEIDGLAIEWGRPFNEVTTLLDGLEKFKPYEGWANIRCKCTNIFGLAATECEVRAPFSDKPILQVQYELSPIKAGTFEKLHSPFVKQLKKALGTPLKTESLYHQHRLPKKYISSVVVYTATWMFEDIRVSLSVYGGTREKDSGAAAAGLFIDWINEKEAAKPFRENAKKFEDFLTLKITESTHLQKFKLLRNQRPFRIVHFELNDPYVAEKDPEFRASQLALYNRELYQTPEPIASRLEISEIALYTFPESNQTFVSNKWDTVCLEPKDENQIIYYEVLPARGPGGKELKIKELLVDDSKESNSLIELRKDIENKTGLKIEQRESYDE